MMFGLVLIAAGLFFAAIDFEGDFYISLWVLWALLVVVGVLVYLGGPMMATPEQDAICSSIDEDIDCVKCRAEADYWAARTRLAGTPEYQRLKADADREVDEDPHTFLARNRLEFFVQMHMPWTPAGGAVLLGGSATPGGSRAPRGLNSEETDR